MNKKQILILAACLLLVFKNIQAQSTSLIEAVRNNKITEIKQLIQNGADVNACDDDSDNVLINAAMYASEDCMKLLLANKANPNMKNKYGHTALMLCTNNIDKMKLLIQYGANINDTSISGNTALLIACSGYGMYNTVKWLMDNGANIHAKRWGAETALMRAAQLSDTMTIKLLLNKGFNINEHPWGFTPLMYAVRFGNWDAVFCLLNNGADVNIPDDDSTPPVMWAAIAGNEKAVNLMLPKTKAINTRSIRTNMTPLMWATYSEYDNPAIIQAFLDHGADPNLKTTDGSTALSWALKKGNTKTVALLRKAGVTE